MEDSPQPGTMAKRRLDNPYHTMYNSEENARSRNIQESIQEEIKSLMRTVLSVHTAILEY